MVNNLSAMREPGLIPGEDPLWYSCLENSWTEEPGGLQYMGSQRVRHDLATEQQQEFALLINLGVWRENKDMGLGKEKKVNYLALQLMRNIYVVVFPC